jgi:Xaa-Pro dipeptidase
MWSLPPPSLDEAKGTHDVDEIRHTTELTDILGDTLLNDQNRPLLHIIDSALFPPLTASFVKSGAKSASTSTYLLSALHHARLIKTPHEISLVRKANAISSRAHEVVMNLLGKGAGKPLRNAKGGELPEEWRIEKEAEAEAVFVASCRREGFVELRSPSTEVKWS